jgi:hypothetical protein
LAQWFRRRSLKCEKLTDDGPSFCCYADRKSKMVATAGNRLTLDPMGKCSNAFFSEITNQTESKLDRNVHMMVWTFMYSLALIIFVVSEKKAFEHFTIGSNVNLCPAVAAILDFRSA